jgi:hypothetical protein
MNESLMRGAFALAGSMLSSPYLTPRYGRASLEQKRAGPRASKNRS